MAVDSSRYRTPTEPLGFVRKYRRVLALTFFLSFAAIFTAFMLHGLSVAPEYVSTAAIQATRGVSAGSDSPLVRDPAADARELDACLALLESDSLPRRVAESLTDAERAQFLAPFPRTSRQGPPDVVRLLVVRHWVKSDPAQRRIEITYEHPNPAMAARVANLYAQECLAVRQLTRTQPAPGAALGAQYQMTDLARPASEPYEPKPILLLSDGLILGLNLAAAITFVTGAILHLLTRANPPHKKA